MSNNDGKFTIDPDKFMQDLEKQVMFDKVAAEDPEIAQVFKAIDDLSEAITQKINERNALKEQQEQEQKRKTIVGFAGGMACLAIGAIVFIIMRKK